MNVSSTKAVVTTTPAKTTTVETYSRDPDVGEVDRWTEKRVFFDFDAAVDVTQAS